MSWVRLMAAQLHQPEASAGEAAETRLAEAARDVFADRLKAAWLSGSAVYQGAKPGRSDIDVVLVLDGDVALPADEATLARIRRFVDAYLAVHAWRGLDPDLDFPGEYVVPATLEEAIAWRGFAYEGAVPTEFPPVETSDYWLGRPDRWFHAWVSMTAFSRFLTGDRDYHSRTKLAAWTAVVRFVLRNVAAASASVDDLLPMLAQFGLKPSYRAFWPGEREWVGRAVAALEAEGSVVLDHDRIVPNRARLQQWEREVEAAIADDGGRPPLLLPPDLHREVGRYATRRWAELGAGYLP